MKLAFTDVDTHESFNLIDKDISIQGNIGRENLAITLPDSLGGQRSKIKSKHVYDITFDSGGAHRYKFDKKSGTRYDFTLV